MLNIRILEVFLDRFQMSEGNKPISCIIEINKFQSELSIWPITELMISIMYVCIYEACTYICFRIKYIVLFMT